MHGAYRAMQAGQAWGAGGGGAKAQPRCAVGCARHRRCPAGPPPRECVGQGRQPRRAVGGPPNPWGWGEAAPPRWGRAGLPLVLPLGGDYPRAHAWPCSAVHTHTPPRRDEGDAAPLSSPPRGGAGRHRGPFKAPPRARCHGDGRRPVNPRRPAPPRPFVPPPVTPPPAGLCLGGGGGGTDPRGGHQYLGGIKPLGEY